MSTMPLPTGYDPAKDKGFPNQAQNALEAIHRQSPEFRDHYLALLPVPNTGTPYLTRALQKHLPALLLKDGVAVPDDPEEMRWRLFFAHMQDMQGFRADIFTGGPNEDDNPYYPGYKGLRDRFPDGKAMIQGLAELWQQEDARKQLMTLSNPFRSPESVAEGIAPVLALLRGAQGNEATRIFADAFEEIKGNKVAHKTNAIVRAYCQNSALLEPHGYCFRAYLYHHAPGLSFPVADITPFEKIWRKQIEKDFYHVGPALAAYMIADWLFWLWRDGQTEWFDSYKADSVFLKTLAQQGTQGEPVLPSEATTSPEGFVAYCRALRYPPEGIPAPLWHLAFYAIPPRIINEVIWLEEAATSPNEVLQETVEARKRNAPRKPMSEETKAKLRESMKKAFADPQKRENLREGMRKARESKQEANDLPVPAATPVSSIQTVEDSSLNDEESLCPPEYEEDPDNPYVLVVSMVELAQPERADNNTTMSFAPLTAHWEGRDFWVAFTSRKAMRLAVGEGPTHRIRQELSALVDIWVQTREMGMSDIAGIILDPSGPNTHLLSIEEMERALGRPLNERRADELYPGTRLPVRNSETVLSPNTPIVSPVYLLDETNEEGETLVLPIKMTMAGGHFFAAFTSYETLNRGIKGFDFPWRERPLAALCQLFLVLREEHELTGIVLNPFEKNERFLTPEEILQFAGQMPSQSEVLQADHVLDLDSPRTMVSEQALKAIAQVLQKEGVVEAYAVAITQITLQQTLFLYIDPCDEATAGSLWHHVVETLRPFQRETEPMPDIALTALKTPGNYAVIVERGEQLLPLSPQPQTSFRWPWQRR